jgi:Fimbrial assembly protein (PilN)
MRLNVNLATRPHEDVGNFLRRWGTLTLLLAVLTAGLVYFAIHNWRESRDVNRQITRMQDEIGKLDNERAKAVATLNKPENKVVADQSRFLNTVIQRKSLSWTRIFMDLERIMPNQLHVTAITPELNKQNQLLIHLEVAGSSRDKAIELVRRMEESPSFRQAELISEAMTKDPAKGDAVVFEIKSQYIPNLPEAPSKSSETTRTATLAKKGAQ